MTGESEQMAPARIQALTDGVYAIAMTVLVLGLKVPRTAHNSTALLQGLIGLELRFTDLAISFFLLAVFWSINHRHFSVIARVDNNLVWLNMLSLLFVVLIPFSTTLYGEYHNVTAAAVLFEVNILILGILKFAQWVYVTQEHRLVSRELDPQAIRRGKALNLVTPLVSIIAIGVAFIAPDSSTMLYVLIPVLVGAARRRFPDG